MAGLWPRPRNCAAPLSPNMVPQEKLLERLVRHEVEFVLVGGYAAMVYGVSIMTRDIDVCATFTRENLERIHAAVADANPVHRQTIQPLPFQMPEDFARGLRNLYLKTSVGQLDLLGEIKGVGTYADIHPHSVPIIMPYGEYRLLKMQDLIDAKMAMARPKDLLVIQQLESIRAGARPETTVHPT